MKKLIIFLISLIGCAPFPDLPPEFLGPDAEESSVLSEGETDGQSDTEQGTDEATTTVSDPSSSPANETATPPGESQAQPVELIDPQKLVFNEILYDVPGSDTDGILFVELYAAAAGSLSGYSIRFVNGNDGKITDLIDLPEEAEIADESFYVIADGRTGALETTQVEVFDLIDNFDPQNGPDGMQLLDREGQLMDSVIYGEGAVSSSDDGLALGEGSFAEDPSGGFSLSRFPAGFDTDDNATDFIVNSVPSPGNGDVIESNE